MEPAGIDENYWIKELHNGAQSAIAYFFDLHYQPLCFFSNRLIQNEAEAKDIVAHSFVLLWQKSRDFNTVENVKGFLYKACRNDCLNFIRDNKRANVAQQLYINQVQQREESVLQEIIRAEFLQILTHEISFLPERPKDVFNMIYFEGKKIDEIAVELGLSVQTVRNHKTRAIDLLKTSFLKKGISQPLMTAFSFFIERYYN